MGTWQRHDGFTLVELLLVVAIIGIVSSIAIPQVGRARAAATEASTIESLHTLISGQALFAQTCGVGGMYAPSVTWLTTPPAAGKSAFVGPEFAAGNVVDRSGYRIRFTAGPVSAGAPASCNGLAKGKAVQTYFVRADPLVKGSSFGTRHFATNSNGTIYESTAAIAIFYAGTPPKPAKPIH